MLRNFRRFQYDFVGEIVGDDACKTEKKSAKRIGQKTTKLGGELQPSEMINHSTTPSRPVHQSTWNESCQACHQLNWLIEKQPAYATLYTQYVK